MMNRKWFLLSLSAALLAACNSSASTGEETSATAASSFSQSESIAVPETGSQSQESEQAMGSSEVPPSFALTPRYLSVPDEVFYEVANPPAQDLGQLSGVYKGTILASKDEAAPGKGFLVINEDSTYTMVSYQTIVTGSMDDIIPLVVEEGVTTHKAGYYRAPDGQKRRLQGEILTGDPVAFTSGYITQSNGQYALMPIDSYSFTPSINSEGKYVFNALRNPSPLIIHTETNPTPQPLTLSENTLQIEVAPGTEQGYAFSLERGSAADMEAVVHTSTIRSVQQQLDAIILDMKERYSTGVPYPYYRDITEVPIYPMDEMMSDPQSYVGIRPDNSSFVPEYAWYDYDNGVIFGYKDHQLLILEDGMWLTPIEKWGPE